MERFNIFVLCSNGNKKARKRLVEQTAFLPHIVGWNLGIFYSYILSHLILLACRWNLTGCYFVRNFLYYLYLYFFLLLPDFKLCKLCKLFPKTFLIDYFETWQDYFPCVHAEVFWCHSTWMILMNNMFVNIHSIIIAFQTIELVFVYEGRDHELTGHPMHLHGYNFRLLAMDKVSLFNLRLLYIVTCRICSVSPINCNFLK